MEQKHSILDRGRNPYETIMLLAWPIIVEQLMMTAVQYVDAAMVGSLGANATASIAVNGSAIMLLNGVMMSCGIGFTALVARSVGAQDIDRAKRVVIQAILVIAALGITSTIILCSLADFIPVWMGAAPEILEDASKYVFITGLAMAFRCGSALIGAILRGAGDTKTPLKVNTVVNIINVVGNFLLIFPTRPLDIFGVQFTMPGAGLGVAGAAWATSFSVMVGGVFMLYVLFTSPTIIKLSIRDKFVPDWDILKLAFTISLPAMGERLIMSSAQVIVTRLIASLGTLALAAHSLAGTAESICFMPAFGFASSSTTLVGQSLGAKREDLTDTLSKSSIKLSAMFMTGMGAMLFIFAEPLMRFFTPDPDVIALGATCLRIVAFAQPPTAISMTMAGIFRGAGDTKYPFLVALLSMWGVRVMLCTVFINFMGLGLESVWFCMIIDYLARTTLYYLRYRTGKWKDALKKSDKPTAKAQAKA